MDRLGDLSVAERFPIAFWNAGDRRLHRRVLIRANRENLAGHFAPVEDRRLIGRAVRANGHDPFALWHVAFAGLQKLEVPCRRRGVAFAKLMADHDAKFRDMPDHRHVALLALVGVMGLVLFRDDLRCVDNSLSRRRDELGLEESGALVHEAQQVALDVPDEERHLLGARESSTWQSVFENISRGAP